MLGVFSLSQDALGVPSRRPAQCLFSQTRSVSLLSRTCSVSFLSDMLDVISLSQPCSVSFLSDTHSLRDIPSVLPLRHARCLSSPRGHVRCLFSLTYSMSSHSLRDMLCVPSLRHAQRLLIL